MDRAFLEKPAIKSALPTVDVVKSIREHLILLLNARQGSLSHLKNYGLPDLIKIYQELPQSLINLKQAVLNIINIYEPRLKNCHIEIKPNHSDTSSDSVIVLAVFGQISNGDWVDFEANFLSSGIVFLF